MYLAQTVRDLGPIVCCRAEQPLMTHRVTYFAYLHFISEVFNTGEYEGFANHPRNPWYGIKPPLDFSQYIQIQLIPLHLRPLYNTALDGERWPELGLFNVADGL